VDVIQASTLAPNHALPTSSMLTALPHDEHWTWRVMQDLLCLTADHAIIQRRVPTGAHDEQINL
jgi:hypothetical protein